MAARSTSKESADLHGGLDYLFTWKPESWPYENLPKLVDTFRSRGAVEETWRCAAHRRIRVGDRAYLLKQGPPNRGIFGRGTVVGKPVKYRGRPTGENPWSVPIRFDVLSDPKEHFLVNEEQLLKLAAPPRRWNTQASGVKLERDAARQIDEVIDSFHTGGIDPVERAFQDAATQEIARHRKLGELARRPGQRVFSDEIRRNYRHTCALTGCITSDALQAAHVHTQKGIDDNSMTNGLLLRSDIHTLFDAFLITLSPDGTKVEVSSELTDPSYAFLRNVLVRQPQIGPSPSAENIRKHRKRFSERQKRHLRFTLGV